MELGGGASASTAGLGVIKFQPWVRIGERVNSSVHGPGVIRNLSEKSIGVHWDSNYHDNFSDCWYSDESGNGIYAAGHGIDELTPTVKAGAQEVMMNTNSNAGSSPVHRYVMGQLDQWMPFESAPKDGTPFIVWNGEEMAILNQPPGCALGRWSKRKGKWYGAMASFDNPTHWMKMPKTPNVEGKRLAGGEFT